MDATATSTNGGLVAEKGGLPPAAAVFEAIPLPAYLIEMVDDEFVIRSVNKVALAANPGLPTLFGKPLTPLYADQPWLREDAERCCREKVTVTRDTYVRRPTDNLSRPMRVTFTWVQSNAVIVTWLDLTSLRESEAALVAAEEHFRRVLEAAQEGVWSCDLEGRTISANERMATMLGSTLPELLRSSVYDYLDEPFREVLRERLTHRGRGLSAIEEIPYRRRDGSTVWARVTACPIVQKGTIVGVIAMVSDITPLKTAELELRASREQLRLALRAARMGTWEWDLESGRGSWSEDLQEIYAKNPEEDAFSDFLKLVHPDDRERVRLSGERMLASDSAEPIETELRLVRRDGETRWVHITGQRVQDEAGRARLTGTLADVSARRLLEEQLAQSQKLEGIGRLAGGVAHDFNNLLTVILVTTTLAERRATGDLISDLATIRSAGERARDLTRQLLAFARKQVVSVKPVDLRQVCSDASKLLCRILGEDIVLHLDIPEGIWPARADAAQLSQVIVNLAANARDAMPDGGTLTLTVANVPWGELATSGRPLEPGDYVRLTVADTGAGMDDATRQHVFEPFFTTKPLGNGLGLASSYGIVKQLGGDIEVESHPGSGTRFHILLQRADGAVTSPRPAPVHVEKGKETILLVEDDPMVRRVLIRQLSARGYQVLAAEHGTAALDLVRGHGGPLPLLVSDVVMPGESGPKIAARVRALRPDIRVLFISGYAAEALGQPLEADEFLQKPFSDDDLAAKVRIVLDKGPVRA